MSLPYDPADLSDHFNTSLSEAEELAFQKWAADAGRTRDTYDYDMRGAWKAGITADADAHYPDTYKKPNHPSFSNESQYNGQDGFIGGQWVQRPEGLAFVPGSANFHWRKPEDLEHYFNTVEKGRAILDLSMRGKGQREGGRK